MERRLTYYVPLFGVAQSTLLRNIMSDCYLNIVTNTGAVDANELLRRNPTESGVIGLLLNISIRICITVITPCLPLPPSPPSLPPSLPLVTQQIHCPFQPKQSPSMLYKKDGTLGNGSLLQTSCIYNDFQVNVFICQLL